MDSETDTETETSVAGLAGGAPDFRHLFQSAPGSYLVLTPDLTIVAVSDAYLRSTLAGRDELIGRKLFEVFPENPDNPQATGNMRASLDRVRATLQPDTMPVRRYDLRRPNVDGAGLEEKHWRPFNSPVLGDHGELAYFIHHLEDVTALVLLEQHQREHDGTKAWSSELLDTAPDAMVVVGDDERINLVNVQAEKLFGYTRSELMGQRLDLLIPERFLRVHLGHVRRFFEHPGSRTMGSGRELFGRRKDGTEVAIEVSLSPLRGARGLTVSAAIRDISERKHAEASAKLMAQRLSSAVESIQDAFALFDQSDRLVLCNSVYRRLIGETVPGPLAGRSYKELLESWSADLEFPEEEARSKFRRERLLDRSSNETTFDVRTRDGRSLRVIDRRTPEGGIVKTIWDLTDDEHRAAELREARQAAEAGSAAKSEFLSSMSHELRTPLNAILGFAQLLQRDKKSPLDQRHKERVEQILKGGEHLLRLIDDILDLSRIEAGAVSISTEPVSIAEVLEDARRTLEPMAARQGIRVELDALPPELTLVAADRTRLTQIIMNFGSNAIKYNRPAGKVTFTISTPSPERVRVTVRDTGMGIPVEKQSKLFQPFQRAGQETGPIEGTGIGLVISKRLAQLMKGCVGFRSTSGEGSEFWVEIPTHDQGTPNSVPMPVQQTDAALFAGPGERRRLVLYVEDNPANVTFMKDLVSTFETIDLLTAPTAEMGVELARGRRPELIIMDINLPGMSGLDALRALRAAHETAAIPVIALTAAASERDKQRGVQAGFYRYLTKPVKVDEFIAALDELFNIATSTSAV